MNTPAPVVFVVDDQRSVRKAIERLLRSAGLAVATYASAEEFLAAFDPDQPGCVVLDLSMPGLSGLDVQAALAARGEALPIVFLTGHAEVPDGVQAMKRGAVDFLTKPVEDKTLVDTVRVALGKDSMERQRRSLVADIRSRLATLTPREAEVLHLRDIRQAEQADSLRPGHGGENHQGAPRSHHGEDAVPVRGRTRAACRACGDPAARRMNMLPVARG
jgi:FixJ family two-component response regulator